MHTGLWVPRKTIPSGLLAKEFLRREGAQQREYLRSKGIVDRRLEKELDRQLAPAIGSGSPVSADNSSTSTLTTGSFTVAANGVVIVGIKWESASRTPTISSNGVGVSSWTYTTVVSNGSWGRVAVGVASGGTGSITVDFGSTTDWTEACAIWFSGCDTVSPLDTSGTATGTTSTQTVAALTNSVADSVYILHSADFASTNFSAWAFGGTGGTEIFDGDTSGMGYLIVSSAASRNGTVTASGAPDYAATMVIIKGAGASGITGELGATIPPFTIAMAGAVDLSAQWAATFGGFGGSQLTGALALQAELNAQMPAWTAALTAGAPNLNAELQAQLNAFVVNFVSNLEVQANLNAAINAVQAAFTSTAAIEAQLNALIPALTAALIEDTAMEGSLAAQLPGMLTQFTGAVAITGDLNAALAAFNAQFRESVGGGALATIVKRKLLLLMNEDEE